MIYGVQDRLVLDESKSCIYTKKIELFRINKFPTLLFFFPALIHIMNECSKILCYFMCPINNLFTGDFISRRTARIENLAVYFQNQYLPHF